MEDNNYNTTVNNTFCNKRKPEGMITPTNNQEWKKLKPIGVEQPIIAWDVNAEYYNRKKLSPLHFSLQYLEPHVKQKPFFG